MGNKYLVTLEFRYTDIFDDEPHYKTKISTIGVYDCFESACINGNNTLELLESKFKLHEFPNGQKANKERFGEYYAGSKRKLVTDLAYLRTPFKFFLSITELVYDEIEKTIDNVLESCEKYKNWKNAQTD